MSLNRFYLAYALIFGLSGPVFAKKNLHQIPSQYLSQELGRAKIRDLPQNAELVASYKSRDRAYLYDQGLALIVFTHENDQGRASRVANALQYLQATDGSWKFSYPDEPAIPSITGAMAWAVLGLSTYQKKFKTRDYDAVITRALNYFLSLRLPPSAVNPGAIRFSKLDDPSKNFPTSQIVSIEHHLDLIAVIDSLPDSKKIPYSAVRADIVRTLRDHWVGYRFLPGTNESTRERSAYESYLDTQAWGYLALAELPEFKDLDLIAGLRHNCKKFLRKLDRTPLTVGFYESDTRQQRRAKEFIWLEGSYSMTTALKLAQKKGAGEVLCGDYTVQAIESSLDQAFLTEGQGVPYATQRLGSDFTDDQSVAATAWAYFSKREINPFKP